MMNEMISKRNALLAQKVIKGLSSRNMKKTIWIVLAIALALCLGTSRAEEPVDGGWGTASDSSITENVKALFDKAAEGLTGVDYIPVVYLGGQVVAGYNHAILCQATVVYPDAVPRWVIMYLFEDLDGSVTITDIVDLVW